MPGRRLQIIDEGLAAVDQLQPTAVVKDALFQNGGGAPQLAGPSVELLGQIHLVTIRSRQTEQGIRLLLQICAVSAGCQSSALIVQSLVLLDSPAAQTLAQLVAGSL